MCIFYWPVTVVKADLLHNSEHDELEKEPLKAGEVALVVGPEVESRGVHAEGEDGAGYKEVEGGSTDTAPHSLHVNLKNVSSILTWLLVIGYTEGATDI